MANAETKLSGKGKEFIRHICNEVHNSNGVELLEGNGGTLPFSDDGNGNLINKRWTSNIIYNGTTIINNNELGEALIDWFQKWADIYQLDPNILAAQTYINSGYYTWKFSKTTTASGINMFKMKDIYDIVVRNFGGIGELFWSEGDENLNKIVGNLENNLSEFSYSPQKGTKTTKEISKRNRALLHQNIINNPELMIKAQARYMKYLSDNCEKLASSALLCFSRGFEYAAKTYTYTINNLLNDYNNDINNPYVSEGLDYVLKVWGVLGDKDNKLEKNNKLKNYKPSGYSFGYNLFSDGNDLISYPNENFEPYSANVEESKIYNVNNLEDLSIVNDPRYRFIYFPEDQYIQEPQISKKQIVLHHTVSGGKDDVGNDVRWWQSKGERVATAFIIARTGKIFQLFDTNYWAYHLGLKTSNNLSLNQTSIGIEIDSWGGLIWGRNNNDVEGWFPAAMDSEGNIQQKVVNTKINPIPITNVQLYPNGFRGFYAFEKYTKEQIEAVRDLILSLSQYTIKNNKEGKYPTISLRYNPSMWDVSESALRGDAGIWTHVSYREDKSDCHPQPELIKMLQELEDFAKSKKTQNN